MKDQKHSKAQIENQSGHLLQKAAKSAKSEVDDNRLKRPPWKEGHKTLSKILNTLIEHVVYHDMEMRVLWANNAACQSVGLPLDQVIGRHCYEIWPQRTSPCENCPVSLARETGRPQSCETQTPDGRCWQISASPMFDANGHIEAMVELTLDITERVRAVKDLKKIKNEQEDLIKERTRDLMILNEQLRQEVNVRKKQEAKLRKQKDYIQQLAMEVTSAEDRERQRLASILHDDLQQTLAYLKLQMSTLFSDDKNNENVDHLIGIINDCLGRCRDLAHEMNPIIIKNKDFKSALEWLCLQMKNRYGLKVALQTSSDLKIQSTTLLSMLIRSIRELLFNIVKHSGVKNAFVEVMADRDWIQIAVKDTGRGCDLDILKNKQNTGEVFGLFDIEDRIQFIGGNVHVVSKLGRGFTVTLDVPRDVILPSKRRQKVYPQVMLTEMQPATTTDALDPDLDTTSIRVLIVDDHELFREGLSKMLQGQEGISVVGRAADGREAIQLALQLNPDVILMDLSMPVLDGIKATAQIHAQLPNIKIIGLTIHEEPSAFQAMLDSGASACLSKTSSPRELVESIRFPKNEHSRN